MTKTMKPSVLLAKAKKLIQTRGWCRGEYHKKGDGYCPMGALLKGANRATTLGIAIHPAFDKRTKPAFDFLQSSVSGCFANWNDAKDRTKKEVLIAFDKAIRLAKEAGE